MATNSFCTNAAVGNENDLKTICENVPCFTGAVGEGNVANTICSNGQDEFDGCHDNALGNENDQRMTCTNITSCNNSIAGSVRYRLVGLIKYDFDNIAVGYPLDR